MRKLTAVFAVLCGGYVAWPYVSLYDIRQDVQAQNLSALRADFDWDQLRDGLKADIADGITGVPGQAVQVASAGDDLPPFGSGFVTNMAGSIVDQNVTPERLAGTVSTLDATGAPKMDVANAFLTSSTSFVVALRATGTSVRQAAIRLRLDLVRSGFGARWKVTRAWLPQEMLAAAEPHAS